MSTWDVALRRGVTVATGLAWALHEAFALWRVRAARRAARIKA